METTYRSKIDTWIGAALIGSIVICAIGIWQLSNLADGKAQLPAIPILVLGIVLPAWVLVSTTYTLSAKELLIRSGPFKWLVPIASIASVTPTSNPLSSPALSMDRLEIKYAPHKVVMISPQDKEQFLRELASVCEKLAKAAIN